MIRNLVFLLLALAAEVLGTVGGFGSSLFFVPVAGFFFDFHAVLGITAAFHVVSNLTKIGFFRKGLDWKLSFRIGVPAVAFVVLGAWLSEFISGGVLEIFLALFLIGFSLLFLIRGSAMVKSGLAAAVTGGAGSGFIAGLVGTGGAIRGLVLSAFNLPKDCFIATSALIDLGVDLSRSVVYFRNGYIHLDTLKLVLPLIIVSIAGTYIGKRLLNRVSEDRFRKIVLVLILVVGIISLGKVLFVTPIMKV